MEELIKEIESYKQFNKKIDIDFVIILIKNFLKNYKSKTMYKLKAIANTIYQLSSVRQTGLLVTEINGTYIGEQIFNTKEEALDFMRERAYLLAEDTDELDSMLDEINKYNQLGVDAVTMFIELV